MKRVSILNKVFELHPDKGIEFANATEFGIRGFDITDSDSKAVFIKHMFLCGRYELQEGPPIHRSATAVVVHAKDHQFPQECKRIFDTAASITKDYSLNFRKFSKAIQDVCCFLGQRDVTENEHEEDKRFENEFNSWDKDNSGTISQSEFMDYCFSKFGSCRRVVLKFMSFQVIIDTCMISK